ncbi:MAG: EamA family transporter [Bacteroidales bacterium]|nr:EamA family transporter [Bacteroidales bacterium]
MNKKRLFYGYAAAVISTILWGASFVWTTDLLQVCNFPAISIVTFRLLIASVFMLCVFKTEKIKKGDLKYFLLLSLFQPFLYFIGETYGIKYIGEASFSAVMISLIPVAAPFALSLVYKRKLKSELVLGAVISVVGVVLMSLNISNGGSISIKGVLFLCEAIVTAVCYNVVLEKLIHKDYKPTTITAYQNIFALIFYIPLCLSMEYKDILAIDWTFRAIADLVALSLLCSSVAYVCYSYGARIISVAKEAVFNNGIPVVTIIISLIIGQEAFSWRKILGMSVVILGLMISQTSLSKFTGRK